MLRLLSGWFHGLAVSSMIWGLVSKLSSELSYGLSMASLWPVMAGGVV